MAALVDERKPDFTTHRTQDDWANFRYRGGGSLIIQVVTTVQLLPDCLGDFLLVLNEVVPMVKAEEGCLVYEPMVDCEIGLPSQGKLRQNTVTLVEAWLNLDALNAHLKAPLMASFREAAKDYVQGVSHQVLRPVS